MSSHAFENGVGIYDSELTPQKILVKLGLCFEGERKTGASAGVRADGEPGVE